MSDHLAEDYMTEEDRLSIDQDAECYACDTGTCESCPSRSSSPEDDFFEQEADYNLGRMSKDDPKEDR